MIVLGVADQPAPAAAVVVDDRPVALVSGEMVGEPPPGEGGIPWVVVDAALRTAGVTAPEVDVVAIAGRFLEPLALRVRPRVRRLVAEAVSGWVDVAAWWQTALRRAGFGTYAGDVTAEHLERDFRRRGFDPRRVVAVDAHRALAEAAYATQPVPDALVVSLHPLGDGVALSVWRGSGAQLDRVLEQADVVSLHAHLARVDAALGLRRDARRRLGALAARGTVDLALRSYLAEDLHAEGPRLSRPGQPRPVLGRDPLVERLTAARREDAAASAWENLADTALALVRRHVRAQGLGDVVLAGDVFDDPRLVARVAELPDVRSVHVLPRPGREALALGAAVAQAGLGPADRPLRLGPQPDDEACGRALGVAGLGSVRRATLGAHLAAGGSVVRWRDRAGPGRHGLGTRCVLVRADDAAAMERVRRALGVPIEEEPLIVTIPTANEPALGQAARLARPLALGMAAPLVDDAFRRRYPPAVAPDGRAWILRATPESWPGLHQIVHALLRASGCGAVAAFPLAEADGPLASEPSEAIEIFRRSGAAALQLGSFWVEQGRA